MNRIDSRDTSRTQPIDPFDAWSRSPATRSFRAVDLAGLRNNRGFSERTDTGAGRFNVWGNSFPAEHVPPPGRTIVVDGVPFVMPPRDPAGDNVRCAGQYVPVPAARCDWAHLLAAAERRAEDTVALHFDDGAVDLEALRVSDFWAAPAWFGEREAFRAPVMHYPHHVQPGVPALMWAQRAPVARRTPLVGLRLPRNVAIHVVAITVEAVADAPTAGETP